MAFPEHGSQPEPQSRDHSLPQTSQDSTGQQEQGSQQAFQESSGLNQSSQQASQGSGGETPGSGGQENTAPASDPHPSLPGIVQSTANGETGSDTLGDLSSANPVPSRFVLEFDMAQSPTT